MAYSSVWDWQTGDWRVYQHDQGGGMFDPHVVKRPANKDLGVTFEDVLGELPYGARYVGRSAVCLGRACVDARARQQATAPLPEGIGAVQGAGGLGAFELAPSTKTGLVVALALAGGLTLAWAFRRKANAKPKRPRPRPPKQLSPAEWEAAVAALPPRSADDIFARIEEDYEIEGRRRNPGVKARDQETFAAVVDGLRLWLDRWRSGAPRGQTWVPLAQVAERTAATKADVFRMARLYPMQLAAAVQARSGAYQKSVYRPSGRGAFGHLGGSDKRGTRVGPILKLTFES